MTDSLAFLDACGRDPALLDDYTTQVTALGLDAEQTRALLARDAAALARLLNAAQTMVCGLFPAEDEPQKQDDQPEPDQAPGEDTPEQR
jgi:hypothetical protein